MDMRLVFKRKRRALAMLIGITTVTYFVVVRDMAINTAQFHAAASESSIQHNASVLITGQQSITTGLSTPQLSDLSFEPSAHFHDFVRALRARADADKYILLAMIDESFTDMAINFYEASLRAHHVDNFLFIGVGRKTCETLTNMSIPCFYYADDPSAGKVTSYRQQAWNRKMNIRTDMILEALSANFTVLHSDTDVAFLGNPVPLVKVHRITLVVRFSFDLVSFKFNCDHIGVDFCKLLWVRSSVSIPSFLFPHPFPHSPYYLSSSFSPSWFGRSPAARTTFGAFLGSKSATGESSFSAVHKIIASAHKIQALAIEKIAKLRQIVMDA